MCIRDRLCIFVLLAGAAGSDFYVQDESGVLSDETYQFIMRTAPALEQQAEGAQIVVLTVPTTGGMDEAEFALERARTLGVGDAEKNNGVLILLVTGDRKVRVEVGYGLEGALNDAKVGRLIDERALDYYKENDFDRGTLELYKGVLSAVMREYGIEELADYRAEEEPNRVWEIVGPIVVLVLDVYKRQMPARFASASKRLPSQEPMKAKPVQRKTAAAAAGSGVRLEGKT